jgi:hypothetical protein
MEPTLGTAGCRPRRARYPTSPPGMRRITHAGPGRHCMTWRKRLQRGRSYRRQMTSTGLSLLAGIASTMIFAVSVLPMVVKAWRTRDLRSYSRGHLVLANVGNGVHSVYVWDLPPGPIWALHGFYLVTSALMLAWKIRYPAQPAATPRPANRPVQPARVILTGRDRCVLPSTGMADAPAGTALVRDANPPGSLGRCGRPSMPSPTPRRRGGVQSVWAAGKSALRARPPRAADAALTDALAVPAGPGPLALSPRGRRITSVRGRHRTSRPH